MSDPATTEPVILAGIEQQEAVPPPLTPGAQLAAQRQARGWTVEEVAMQLNLAPRQILAIETDNYAALPGIASVRGFIRGYAKILKIDASPLLTLTATETAKLGEPAPTRKVLSEPFSETRLPSMGRQGLSSRTILVIGILVLLSAIVFVSQQMGMIPRLQEMASSMIKETAPNPNPVQSEKVTTTSSAAAEVSASTSTNQADSNGMSSESLAPAAVAVDSTPSATSVTAQVESAPPPSASSLVLSLRADSWIEIARANRTVLVSRLFKAGTTETLEISEPVSLTIGNVAGVDATWRGEPLDVKSGTKTNVIRLNLK